MIAGLVFQVAIIGLIVWLVYKAYECGTDNSKCSKFVYGLIRTGTKYDKYVDRVPSTQGELINDTKVKSANTCAAWCNKTYGCNGFVWDGTCHALAGDDPKMLTLIPAPGATLYIDQNVDHPGAGFRYIGPAGTDFSSNVSQRLGTVIPNSTITNCAKSCIDQMTSNCIGYSLLTTSNTCQLISNISNTVVTSNIVSYTWGTYSSTDYTEAKF
jgi:hypothetical protein